MFCVFEFNVTQGDEETMKSMMRLSTERRRYFDKKPDEQKTIQ